MKMTSCEDVSVCTINLVCDAITDSSEILPAFCQSIEALLRQGIKRGLGVTGLVDRDYWNFIEGVISSNKVVTLVPLSISHIISVVRQCRKTITALARGRLFLRIALSKGLLYQTLHCLLENQEYVRYWYKDASPLVAYREKRVVLDILKSLKKKTYRLNIKNCSFLHESWIIPEMHEYEFVPCAVIGVTLFSLDGKCIILSVKPGSAADEYGVQPGDCLDELYGQVIDDKWAQKIGQLKRKNQGRPVTATIIKGRFSDGRWFVPIFQRYKALCSAGKCTMMSVNKPCQNESDTTKDPTSTYQKFNVIYLGATDVGSKGNCVFVQNGISKLIEAGKLVEARQTNKKDVCLQLMERDILITCLSSNEILGRFSYTETSSCALKDDDQTYFGFITGNTTCSFADTFKCHAFKSATPTMARVIIEGIGKGFDRTVYCV